MEIGREVARAKEEIGDIARGCEEMSKQVIAGGGDMKEISKWLDDMEGRRRETFKNERRDLMKSWVGQIE